jgi:hypothetical protein
MYWLIEDLEQLKVFYNSGFKEAFVEVIPFNNFEHPTQNNVSAVYVRPIEASKGFMLCSNHSETLGIELRDIEEVLKKFNKLYCRDKKELLHYFPLKSLWDISLPPNTYIRPTTQTHDIFYNKHKDNREINVIIPIVKHYEICERTYNDLQVNIGKNTNYDTFFNSKTSLVFNAIERNGIRVHKPTFEEYFHPIDGEFTYSQYNLKTLTTRPSNRFNGVNYAALNKEDGSRKSFIPQNEKFIEIDITAYHPTISSHMVDFEFSDSDIHSSFATMYGVDREKAKELTFKQLYGGVFKQYKELPFFRRIQSYIDNTWQTFQKTGEIETEISGYKYYRDSLENMNPQKLFNYILQNYETSQNILILWDILSILRGKKSRLVLYTYDSFLIDLSDEEKDLVKDVQKIFENYKLNTKIKYGSSYDFR